MQSIIVSLANQHGLSTAEVIQEIESAFAQLLTRWCRQEVMVFLREEMRLEIVTYNKLNGLPVQNIFELPAVLSRNQLKTILENHLATAVVIKQVRLLKYFERSLIDLGRSHPQQSQRPPPDRNRDYSKRTDHRRLPSQPNWPA